ncbi:MAG: hypothetical protein FWC16_10000 [Defluviitaleaceae bacterium]|nr:hypothetical protein [Defluviitaleaceae bacterium]MCL2275247.1 hypothetical protein [Defluviitaleaceae bacterium]
MVKISGALSAKTVPRPKSVEVRRFTNPRRKRQPDWYATEAIGCGSEPGAATILYDDGKVVEHHYITDGVAQ